MPDAIARCREEQRRAAEWLAANPGHPESIGDMVGYLDWCAEEGILTALRAPFPYFGGKSRIALEVWDRLGDTPNYVEPFFGSGAVLLARPHEPRTESVNDVDCYLTNFWRAVREDPGGVATWADWPVSELDQNARHLWLLSNSELRERMNTDPEWYDVKAAGWWVWGQNIWIGSGWCDSRWYRESGNAGTGINRKRPHLGNAGRGINRQLPHLGDAGKGINRTQSNIAQWLTALQERLRRVRITCGSWERLLTPAVTTKHGMTAVFLDPPYASDRDETCYANDSMTIAHDVAAWCRENGDNPLFRIALCGHMGEHEMPSTWRVLNWKTRGGYGSQGEGRGRENADKECIWFSPHCLNPTPSLFD